MVILVGLFILLVFCCGFIVGEGNVFLIFSGYSLVFLILISGVLIVIFVYLSFLVEVNLFFENGKCKIYFRLILGMIFFYG